MAALVLNNTQILLGAYDVSGFAGSLSGPTGSTAVVDVTPFGGGGFGRSAVGLITSAFTLDGFADFASNGISTVFTGTQLGQQQAVTVCPSGGAATGDTAILTRGFLSTYSPWGGSPGEAAKFAMTMTGDSGSAVGSVLAPLASRGALTGTQVSGQPAVGALQRVYGALHVTGAVGTSLAVKIQSATTADTGFASPTDRMTFATTSTIGWQFLVFTGGTTDTRWRAVATVGTSTFTYFVAMGIS